VPLLPEVKSNKIDEAVETMPIDIKDETYIKIVPDNEPVYDSSIKNNLEEEKVW